MRIGVALSVCLLVVASSMDNTAEAQGKGGRKGARGANLQGNGQPRNVDGQNGGQQGANGANCAGAGQQAAMMQARMQQGGMQQGAGPAQMAQMLLANFDQDGDGALQEAELEQAMLALMQRMQQMQKMQQMQAGGAMQGSAAAGMMSSRGQSSQRFVSGAGVQNRAQNSAQRGGSRGGGKRR